MSAALEHGDVTRVRGAFTPRNEAVMASVAALIHAHLRIIERRHSPRFTRQAEGNHDMKTLLSLAIVTMTLAASAGAANAGVGDQYGKYPSWADRALFASTGSR